ncbi:MAG: arylsulfatase A-like enzyme [Myxococcota bacterium]|jgi:arylsulfatase A-like enzyme
MSVPPSERGELTRLVGVVLLVSGLECAWLAWADMGERLWSDQAGAVWAAMWPTLACAVAGLALGAVASRAPLGPVRGTPTGVAWALLGALTIVPIGPDWPWVVLLLTWGLGMLVVSRWAWVAPALMVLSLASLVLSTPARETRPASAKRAAGPHIVLVTLDTFRADHVGAIGGYRRQVDTPNLDRLAASGALYTEGVADVPLTGPSHLALLTGQPPWELGVVRNGDQAPADARLVTRALQDHGYRTGAFVSARVLDPAIGLDAGFDHYDHHADAVAMAAPATIRRALIRLGLLRGRPASRRGDVTVERALAWLDSSPEPAFLWVHLYDPHSPYAPPPPWDTRYDARASDAPGHPDEVAAAREGRAPMVDFLPRDLRHEIAKYAGEVSWTDAVVGRLIDALPPDAAVVVVADHGESLVEHGYLLNHGANVLQPSIRVPIWVRAPGFAPGRRVDAPVPARRVAATLRELAGLPAEGPTLADPPSDGWIVSVAPGQQSRFDLRLDRPRMVALRRGDQKWVVDDQGRTSLYDLVADPGEVSPALGAEGAATAARTAAAVFRQLRDAGRSAVDEPGLEDALRELGYVE